MRIEREALALALALVLACLFASSCRQACSEDVSDGDPVHRDYGQLRLSGDYRCNTQSTCTVAVTSETSALLTATNADGTQFRIEYQLTYGPPKDEKLKVTMDVVPDARCGVENQYRQETWTVPTLTLEAVSATQGGRALDLTSDVLILNHKSSTLSKLVVTHHFVDVLKNEEYLGVEVTSEPRSYLRLPITRSGSAFTVGPR